MKIDPKSMILGSLISLVLFAGFAYAYDTFVFRCVVTIPPSVGIEIESANISEESGVSYIRFPDMLSDTVSMTIRLVNRGSEDIPIKWRVEDVPSGLDVYLTYFEYVHGGGYVPGAAGPGDHDWSGSLTVPRGEYIDVTIWIQDVGAQSKTHSFTLIFWES